MIIDRINDMLRALFDIDNDPVFQSLVCDKNGTIPGTILKPTDIDVGAFASQVEYLRLLAITLMKQIYINQASGEFLKYQLEIFFNNFRQTGETDSAWVERTNNLVFYPKVSRAAIIYMLRPYSSEEPQVSTVNILNAFADFSYADFYLTGKTDDAEPVFVTSAIATETESNYFTIQIILYNTTPAQIYDIQYLLEKIIAAGMTYVLLIYNI